MNRPDADLKIDVPAVCLASRSEGIAAKIEVHARVPIALLTPTPIAKDAPMIHVLVKDSTGKEQLRRRFLLQLGPSPIKYMEDAPKGCNCNTLIQC